MSAGAVAADTTTAAGDNPYATFPSVPKTATINGFADRIYALLPECARDCVRESTGSTPCPYWDTGCLCVMPQWGAAVAQCFVDNCQGDDVHVATSLAISQCSSAGVWEPYWMIPASLSTALDQAAAAEATT
ncbi:repressed by TUP1 protein 5, partial [Scheffersomyces stipitis CBS 6054]